MLGLIGKKVGMTQMFNQFGELMPVTVIQIEPNVVVGERTPEKNGYSAVVLGAMSVKPNRVTSPVKGQFAKNNVDLKRHMIEMRDFEQECSVGDTLGVEIFENDAFVDVIGTSKGKGYQGVMKRHGFGGGRKTHGSKFHREGGSTGMAAYPARVIKGTKMPGRMGGARTTTQNLRIVRVDGDKQMIIVGGAVPGANDGMVIVRRSKKKG